MLTMHTFRGLLAAALLACGLALAAAPQAMAQPMTATTTVDQVFEANGAVQFSSPMGLWQLDYEAGVEANTAARATLERLAGTGKSISFTYFMEGQHRILTKSSVASLAWMR
ncbi:hypothetical protein [Megalodesulfovibrio gigas]|uniref:Uncharacterized protein n=1 Tax=Megalodesulfovibrio gigas (strain ATCC 19364 / DSM 1382 / NCIMB 9332 / VKM B-1759) TaxID=1121448 RepID=T2GBD9_MEGG1|nr:hypothetical protein [Megalodesulfovibrio gigas]AGW13222.1 hypothetical protein DGI_1376 [Megalodesulfovibrio gigas DSM 1382 = ATCC 19364]